MTERERLVEMLNEWGNKENDGVRSESIANYLLAPCKVGDTVWVIEREDGEAVDISGVIFLAKSKGCIIATSQINDYDLDGTIAYHIIKTQNNFDTNLMVYSDDDWFFTREEAEKALHKIKHNSLCETETYKVDK